MSKTGMSAFVTIEKVFNGEDLELEKFAAAAGLEIAFFQSFLPHRIGWFCQGYEQAHLRFFARHDVREVANHADTHGLATFH